MKTWIAALGTSLALLTCAAHADPVVYQQGWANDGNTWASQNDPGSNGAFAKVYDNFSVAGTTSITDVHWTGTYFNPSQQGQITSFLIEFWSNAGGPGALLFSESVSGTANETLLSDASFSYDVDLSNAFLAQGGTTYWLSIQATMVFPPQWGWAVGTGGDGASMQDFFGNRTRLDSDLAFSLTGVDATTVPEPGSMLLVALGLLGAAAAGRRKLPR